MTKVHCQYSDCKFHKEDNTCKLKELHLNTMQLDGSIKDFGEFKCEDFTYSEETYKWMKKQGWINIKYIKPIFFRQIVSRSKRIMA